MKKLLMNKYFYISLGAAITLIFLAQNNKAVSIDFFFWELASANLLALFIVFFVMGAASGIFASKISRFRSRKKERSLGSKQVGAKRAAPRQNNAYENSETGQVKTPLH